MPVASVLTRNDGNAPSANGRVRQWLSRAGLGEYRENFAGASEREFAALGMVDFQQFGVVDVAHKQTLFRLIKNLNAEGVVFEKNPLRASLLDVDAAEHDEFLLSPLARRDPKDGSARNDSFAPSPAEDDPRREKNPEEKDVSEKPLEHLRRLSRESRVKDVVSEQNVSSVSTRGSSAEEDVSEKDQPSFVRDPAKTPFVAGRSVDSNDEDADTPPPPLAALPADQPRIRVVVRKRPLNAKELARDEEDVVTVDRRKGSLPNADEKAPSSVTVWEPKTKVDLTRYTEEHAFNFDDVFSEEVDNDEVYRTTVAPLVGTVFDKCKVTCFAYGQTGSGKTYTMNPLPIRAAREILGELKRRQLASRNSRETDASSSHINLALHVSFFEIYGGKVYDLLNGREKLVIREDARAQMCVVGLKEFEVDDVRLVEQLIAHGTAARCVGSTGANAESSRSHAIMQFVLKRSSDGADDDAEEKRRVPASVVAQRLRNAAGANHERIHGKFSFIDLAGSERGADTSENDRQTRIEGAEINKSLLALKECIRALDRGTGHVPFRGSKLTEVLRDSFMGNSRTVMIANVSPATGSCEHTLNTLRYAYRVKELRDGGKDGEPSKEKAEAASSRATRFAADGVTPVGAPASEKEKESTLPSDKERTRRDGANGNGNGNGNGTSGSAFDPRVAAKAAAARVRDATRRSAELEAEKAAEKKRGAASFLTKGGGAGGGATAGVSANALLSPRKAASSFSRERPKSAAPGGFLSTRGAGGGSPTKEKDKPSRMSSVGVASRARPQTARVGSGTSLGAGARRESAVHGARKNAQPSDPRVTAFDPVRGGESGGSGPGPSKEATRTEPSAAEAKASATAAEKKKPAPAVPAVPAVPAGGDTKKILVPLSGSALAAAKAHAHLTGVGPPVDQEEMVKAHDELINVILEEEEAVIAAHRAQIENAMALVKREMSLLAEVDKPGSAIDVYVEHLADVLEKKQRDIESLREKVRAFRAHLKEEEVLSKAVGLH